MKWQVTIRPKAEADLRNASEWYDLQRPGLGIEFLNEVGRGIKLLEHNPERRVVYYRGFRRLLTRRFPYKIFYRTEVDRVIVFRILHVKQDHRWKIKD